MKQLLCLLFVVGFIPVGAQEATPAPKAAPLVAQAGVSASSAQGNAANQTANASQAQPAPESAPSADQEEFVTVREEMTQGEVVAPTEESGRRVEYKPATQRDPTLSPDDILLLEYREKQRLAALEAERQRQLAEERRRQEEAERLRQLELARIKDPAREVRNKIKISGIIGQEVFIGSKIYTIGNSIYGAKIVEVRPEEVVFSYKGHKFVRKVQL